MHPTVRDAFCTDLELAQEQVRTAVVDKRARSSQTHWGLWVDFCEELGQDPWFQDGSDPIPYLQVFAVRYRSGRIAPRGKPVRSSTVSDALRNIGQAFTGVGARDPRLDAHGKMDFRLSRQLRKYTKDDPPAQRVKPIPLSVVTAILDGAHAMASADDFKCIADMICIAFYFLMRPGEYNDSGTNTPFRMQDVKLYRRGQPVDWRHASDLEFGQVDSVSLTFTTQKNGVKGEVISHGCTNHALACPVKAVVRRLRYLRSQGAPETAMLCTWLEVHNGVTRRRTVKAKMVTAALRAGILNVDPLGIQLDIKPDEVDSRSLRAGGATALLCAGLDFNIIQLMGRWKSDAMIRYLHVSADPHTRRYAQRMFDSGNYRFNPGWYVPAMPLNPQEA